MRNHDMTPPHDRRRPEPRERLRGPRGEWSPEGRGHGHGPSDDGPFGPPRGRRRGRRGGDVRAAVLLLLEEQPRHGDALITEITSRSDGTWSPSPGSVYPVLQQLEDEGLIEIERVDGRKTASLTDAGRETVDTNREQLGTPWADTSGRPASAKALRRSLEGFMGAWQQVVRTGDAAQHEKAGAIVDDARRALYRVLAEDDA